MISLLDAYEAFIHQYFLYFNYTTATYRYHISWKKRDKPGKSHVSSRCNRENQSWPFYYRNLDLYSRCIFPIPQIALFLKISFRRLCSPSTRWRQIHTKRLHVLFKKNVIMTWTQKGFRNNLKGFFCLFFVFYFFSFKLKFTLGMLYCETLGSC